MKYEKNQSGFTLVELLAVIVIMGILMMVAIPSVSRTIENSRKDTFVNTAKAYGNSVRELWSSEGLSCQTVEGAYSPSGVPDGKYYIKISTDDSDNAPVLLDQGGKSSWGNRHMKGYVEIVVETQTGIVGDLDNDFEYKVTDAGLCYSIANGRRKYSALEYKLADINGDGIVATEDCADLYSVVNGALLADYLNVGDEVSIKTTEFYVVVSDDTHGLNVTSNGIASDNLILSDKAVRGDVVMTGARYITSLPNSNICIES